MNHIPNKKVSFQNLGIIEYDKALKLQVDLFDSIIKTKIANGSLPLPAQIETPNYLLFCQHPHVYTLGKSGKESNLLISPEQLSQLQISFYPISRGGDITYHGPGQIVIYPIFDLENFFTDIHQYLRLLEEAVIRTLADYNINAGRITGLTGVWVDFASERARKICAIGVKTSRWVTMHGFALNVNTDLSFFNYIIPCGITNKAVTSLKQELGTEQDESQVCGRVLYHLMHLFDIK